MNNANIDSMGDSDEEADKRNVREKFKHERSDYDRHESRKSQDVTDRYVQRANERLLCSVFLAVIDLGAAQSSIFGSARNFFGSLSRLEPKITAQQQSCTQS